MGEGASEGWPRKDSSESVLTVPNSVLVKGQRGSNRQAAGSGQAGGDVAAGSAGGHGGN